MDIWREVRRFLLIVAILVPGLPTGATPPLPLLPALGAEHQVTVSGVSSGGYMAAQFAVAFSKDVKGVGVVAGGPYGCSQGNVFLATTTCSCAIPGACSSPTPSAPGRPPSASRHRRIRSACRHRPSSRSKAGMRLWARPRSISSTRWTA